MHLGSHIRAFQAQWIRRYLDPGSQPWKSVADVWLAERYPMGRGMILTDLAGKPAMYSEVPLSASYFRQCVLQFETLYLKQHTANPSSVVNGESIFFNNRFTIPIPDTAAEKCSKYLGLKRIYNLLDQASGDLIDDADMRLHAFDLAPPPQHSSSPLR